jgi:hypothetical protein
MRRIVAAVVAVLLLGGLFQTAQAQGQLSVQVLQLLTRNSTWPGTQTFQDLRMSPATIPSDTTSRIYADLSGNLYYNGGLIAGAGGGVTPHNLLSTTHADTVASSPVRGGLIVANSTPKWAQLTITPSSFLQSNATDVIWSTSGANLTNIPAAQLTGTIAAISGVNLTNLNASSLASGTVPLAQLSGITNTQIAGGAGIAYSKLTLTGAVVNADISASAAIVYSKLSLSASLLTTDLTPATLLFSTWASNSCTASQVPQFNGSAWVCRTLTPSDLTGGGTVTSVALAAPAILTVSGSPITTAGTLTLALATQTANLVFAGPSSGGAVAPTFRSLVNADFPLTGVGAGTYSKVTVNTAGLVTTGLTANINTDTTGNLAAARGGTDQTAATNNNTLVGNGAAWVSTNLPNCLKGPLAFTQASNTFSCPSYRDLRELIPAICTTAPAGFSQWSLPSASFAAANCISGTNTVRGVLDYVNGSDLTAQQHLKLPSDWVTGIDINLYWHSTTTAGNVVWSVSTACNAAGATGDPTFNAANTVTSTTAGTANQFTLATIASLTTTGCVAGSDFYLKVERNAGAGGDNMAGTARLADVELVLRRALQ